MFTADLISGSNFMPNLCLNIRKDLTGHIICQGNNALSLKTLESGYVRQQPSNTVGVSVAIADPLSDSI